MINESLEIRYRLGQSGIVYDSIATLLRLAIKRHDRPTVRAHLRSLLSWLESHSSEGIEDPIRAWLTMADAYAEIGAPEGEESALRDGHAQLMERASRITSPVARESYLANVPANRELLARYLRITTDTSDE